MKAFIAAPVTERFALGLLLCAEHCSQLNRFRHVRCNMEFGTTPVPSFFFPPFSSGYSRVPPYASLQLQATRPCRNLLQQHASAFIRS